MEPETIDWGAKIGKICKGEKVIVVLISEPLQEQYISIVKLKDELSKEMKTLVAAYNSPDEAPMDAIEKVSRMSYEASKMRAEFWMAVNAQYKLWKTHCGIRNGFCIVSIQSAQEKMEKVQKTLKALMEEFGFEEAGDNIGLDETT